MENLEANELELAEEAHVLNNEKEDIEEGLDATRIQISTITREDDRVQVNEITSTTNPLVDQPHMNLTWRPQYDKFLGTLSGKKDFRAEEFVVTPTMAISAAVLANKWMTEHPEYGHM